MFAPSSLQTAPPCLAGAPSRPPAASGGDPTQGRQACYWVAHRRAESHPTPSAPVPRMHPRLESGTPWTIADGPESSVLASVPRRHGRRPDSPTSRVLPSWGSPRKGSGVLQSPWEPEGLLRLGTRTERRKAASLEVASVSGSRQSDFQVRVWNELVQKCGHRDHRTPRVADPADGLPEKAGGVCNVVCG